MDNLCLVNSIEECNVVTHAGKFTAGNVFTVILLSEILPEVRLFRTNELPKEALNTSIIAFDIPGAPYEKGKQVRKNGIKYSSLGLLWKRSRTVFLSKVFEDIDSPPIELFEAISKSFDAVFVEAIDAIDNGQIDLLDKNNPVLKVNEQLEVFNLKKTFYKDLSTSEEWKPEWDYNTVLDECFLIAFNYFKPFFRALVVTCINATIEVENAMKAEFLEKLMEDPEGAVEMIKKAIEKA